MSKTKHKSGYSIMKTRYAELERVLAELQATNKELETIIEKQTLRITALNCEVHNAERKCKEQREESERIQKEMLEHMGWWRKNLWILKLQINKKG